MIWDRWTFFLPCLLLEAQQYLLASHQWMTRHGCAKLGEGRQQFNPLNAFVPMNMSLRYCVGLDVGKDNLQVCLSVIDSDGRVVVKASTKVVNKLAGFQVLTKWVAKNRKQDLPLRYVMEATGVYHEQIAWYLYQQDQPVCIILPIKLNTI